MTYYQFPFSLLLFCFSARRIHVIASSPVESQDRGQNLYKLQFKAVIYISAIDKENVTPAIQVHAVTACF